MVFTAFCFDLGIVDTRKGCTFLLCHSYFWFYKQRQAYLIVHVCNTSLWEAEGGV